MPIKDFMIATYKFSELGAAKKHEIIEFCNNQAELYAQKESRGELNINYSLLMMDKLKDKFYKLFRCLVNVGKPKKKDQNKCTMERVELLWKERVDNTTHLNECIFELADLLGIDTINTTTVDDATDKLDDII